MYVRASFPMALLLLLLSVLPVRAQEGEGAEAIPAEPAPAVTLLAGVGTSLGWYGGQLAGTLRGTRLALFAGLGYTPEYGDGQPTGLTFAVGVRRYVASQPHQGYFGLALAQLVTVSESGPGVGDGERLYGPALLGGYQYTSGSGFTVLAGVGVGYAPGFDDWNPPLVPALDLGLGYTWR